MFELWAQFWTKWSTRTSSPDDFEATNGAIGVVNSGGLLMVDMRSWVMGWQRLMRGYNGRTQSPPKLIFNQKTYLGMGQYLLIPFLVGWTSIYQLFWGSLGTRVLTHPHLINFEKEPCHEGKFHVELRLSLSYPVMTSVHNPLKVLTLHQILGHRSNYCFFGLAFRGSGAPNFLTSMTGPPLQSGAPRPASSRCGSRSNLERCINLYKWESSEWT